VSSASVGSVSQPDSSDDTAPWPTKVGISAFIAFAIIVGVFSWWYGCKRAPAQGSRIGMPRRCGDGYQMKPLTLLLLGVTSLALKITALALDVWAVTTLTVRTVDVTADATEKWGLLSEHDQLGTHKYSEGGSSTRWSVFRAGAIIALAAAVLSMIFSLVSLVLLLQMRTGSGAVAQKAEKLYRASGMTNLFASTTTSIWLLGSFMLLVYNAIEINKHDGYSSGAQCGVSFFLFVGAGVLDAIIASSGSACLLNTPPAHSAHALDQQLAGAYHPNGAYVPLAAGHVQHQPQQVVYAQPMHQQYAPVAYAQPAYTSQF